MASHAGAAPAARTGGRAGLYRALTVVGAIAPYAVFGVFLAQEGFDLGEFVEQAVTSTTAVMTLADLTIASIVFLVWMWPQAPQLGLRRWWFVAGNLLVGLCFALPLFLYLREKRR